MKRWLLLGVVVTASAAALVDFGRTEPTWCGEHTSYEAAHRENLKSLRWSLYAVSNLSEKELNDVEHRLPGLTESAVYSLANIYTLRARYVQGCRMQEDDYAAEIRANELFIALLRATTSTEDFPSLPRIAETAPDVFASLDSDQYHGLKFHKRIEGRLAKMRGNEPTVRKDPTMLAAAHLSGKAIKWNEEDLILESRLHATNPEFSKISGGTLEYALSRVEKLSWQDRIELLSSYYTLTQ